MKDNNNAENLNKDNTQDQEKKINDIKSDEEIKKDDIKDVKEDKKQIKIIQIKKNQKLDLNILRINAKKYFCIYS